MADAPVLATKIEPAPDNTQVTGTGIAETAKPEATLLGTKPEGEAAKPEGEVKLESDKPKPEPVAAAIDPAKITLPEGFSADEPVLKSAVDLLLDEKLAPQERAQKLIDLHAAELKKASGAATKYWEDQQTAWKTEAKTAYGPEPAKSPKIIAVSKLIDSLGEKPAAGLREALEMSGMGNHPAVIGAFVAIAERLTEGGTVVAAKPSGAKPTTLGEAFYGNNQT